MQTDNVLSEIICLKFQVAFLIKIPPAIIYIVYDQIRSKQTTHAFRPSNNVQS